MGAICRQNAFSESDPNLEIARPPVNLGDNNDGGFTDRAPDLPASRANTFTYTVNLTKCLASHGRSFNPGETRGFIFAAAAAGVIGFIGNEAVAIYRIRVGKRIGSAALVADGQHAREVGAWALPPEESLLRQEALAHLQQAIARLPAWYRAVYVLAEVEALPHQEIATILGLTVSTAKTRLHRARLLLREALAGQPEGWRATLVTDALEARPQAVQWLPGPSYMPLFAALGVLVAVLGLIIFPGAGDEFYLWTIAGSVFTAGAVARWLWPKRKVLDLMRKSDLPQRTGLPIFSTGTQSTAWWGMVGTVAIAVAIALIGMYALYVRAHFAAESAGGAQRCLDMAVGYAKTRVQFGRPIGQFQAIKHKCAEMLLDVESAKTAAYYGMWVAADDDELPIVSSLAKAYCTEAYFRTASENIQVHGGIGFTWEHDLHLYFKRAKSSEVTFGDATFHRERVAQLINL